MPPETTAVLFALSLWVVSLGLLALDWWSSRPNQGD